MILGTKLPIAEMMFTLLGLIAGWMAWSLLREFWGIWKLHTTTLGAKLVLGLSGLSMIITVGTLGIAICTEWSRAAKDAAQSQSPPKSQSQPQSERVIVPADTKADPLIPCSDHITYVGYRAGSAVGTEILPDGTVIVPSQCSLLLSERNHETRKHLTTKGVEKK